MNPIIYLITVWMAKVSLWIRLKTTKNFFSNLFSAAIQSIFMIIMVKYAYINTTLYTIYKL